MQLRLIIQTVARDFNLDTEALLKGPPRTSTQKSPVREAREAFFYLVRRHVKQLSPIELSEALEVGMATIWYEATRAEERMQQDDLFRLQVTTIEEWLNDSKVAKGINEVMACLDRLHDALNNFSDVLKK